MRLQTAIGRGRTFASIAHKSGGRVAFNLARLYVRHLAATALAAIRPRVRVSAEQVVAQWKSQVSAATSMITLDPQDVFQPQAEKIERYSRFDVNDKNSITRVSADKLYYRDIPYSTYSGEWHFHPGRIGGELARLPLKDGRAARVANAVLNCFIELPNQGAALYYPKTFRLARLRSREYVYSAIAQGQLLAGYARLAQSSVASPPERAAWADLATKIAASLLFPFSDGGVNMEGRVLLEVPNFRSPPEIVLNGWMDALIHLHDYLGVGGTAELQSAFDANVATLAKLLPHFDDESSRLSRYSNVSPYRVRVHFRRSLRDMPRVGLLYRSHLEGFSAYLIKDLWRDGCAQNYFENQILRFSRPYADVLVSSSSLYDLELQVAADATHMEVSSRPFGIWSAPTGTSARLFVIEPASRAGGDKTVFRLPSGLLTTGQPTDFAKGLNFYHTYHVVALLELSRMAREASARTVLRDMALKWLDYIDAPHKSVVKGRLHFADLALVHRQLSNGRGNRNPPRFEDLLSAATRA